MCRKGLGAMVNSINSNYNIPSYVTYDKKLSNSNGKTISSAKPDVTDTFSGTLKSGVSSAFIFEGIPFINLIRRNKKLDGKLVNEGMKALDRQNREALKQIIKGDGSVLSRIKSYVKTTAKSKEGYNLLKTSVKNDFKFDKLLKKHLKRLAKSDSKFGRLINARAEKKLQAYGGKMIQTTALEVVESGAKTAGKKGILSKLGSVCKSTGAGFMLALSGITEALTEVVPTFKELGAAKGMKQALKSSVKVIGDTFGFIAGEQAGVAIGSAIGTAIFPGIGTAVGAVCGFAGGLLGSFVMGKVTKSITGPTEREIANQEQQKQLKDFEEVERNYYSNTFNNPSYI